MQRLRSSSSARIETRDSVVFDASALVHALIEQDEHAEGWLDAAVEGRLRGIVPELVFAETANALLRHVLAGKASREHARAVLHVVGLLPVAVVSMPLLVGAALEIALSRGLTAYDACYAALAEASDAVLVTADARLAAAVPRSALLPAAAPPS